MSLNALQVEFTEAQAKFQVWCFKNGYEIIEAEAFRTQEQAEIYAKAGKGIRNSAHCKKLARDLFRVENGTVTWDKAAYEPLGKKWKTMHDLARWGGDFANRDAVHFSFEYKGVK